MVALQLAMMVCHSGYAFLLLIVAFSVGYFVNLNYIAIHRFYRDRLMETFMPDLESIDISNENLKKSHYPAPKANKANLLDFADLTDGNEIIGPYPIINTNAVLVDSDNRIYQNRGGDNFILSPYYCGSNATGWKETDKFMQGNMTMATAMAISGAAVNPNTGVGGDGITRSKLLSLVMSLLNLRLGYWAHNPKKDPKIKIPNHFYPGIYSLLNLIPFWHGNEENRKFIELSDGGHFENTGVYELVRRKVKLILVCDGGQDKEFSFSDFQTTVRRIEDDFGAKVSIDHDNSPDKLIPQDGEKKYPTNAEFSKQGFTLAKITYADNSEGYIIYLKTTLIDSISFKVKGYKAQNPDFPDETTVDQFFDEVQFEAYRELGYRIAIDMIGKLGLDNKRAKFGKLLNI